ncbi:MAG: type II CRISPR-associated endonuclease Cas1 [Alistipes sp.]
MIKRALFFSTPYCLSLKNSQMIINTREMPEMKRSVPIEDIGCVVLEHQQTSITLPLLNALSDNNVAVILCGDNRMPNAMLMNLDSNSTQGESYRAQIEASEPLKKGLWRQVVEAKIRNQAALLESLGREGSILKPYWMNVKSGDADNREGDAPNSMLNYGYSILRAAVARAIMGSGLFPALGIFHRNRYNAFPLADDIMEPYRPFVDRIVYRLYDEGRLEPDKDVKAELLRVLYTDTRFEKTMRPLDIALTFTSSSLAACFAGTRKKIAYPILE